MGGSVEYGQPQVRLWFLSNSELPFGEWPMGQREPRLVEHLFLGPFSAVVDSDSFSQTQRHSRANELGA